MYLTARAIVARSAQRPWPAGIALLVACDHVCIRPEFRSNSDKNQWPEQQVRDIMYMSVHTRPKGAIRVLAEERRRQIVELLNSEGSIQVSKLSASFSVTEETIRRDLDALNRRNLLKRTHGGAVALQSRQEVPFDIRRQTNVEEKRQAAVKAARLIEPGDTLFLDISSTAMFLAKELSNMKDITVITNSARIALEFIDKTDITLISTGGILRPNSYSLVGPLANDAVGKYYADKFFSSCRGFSLEHGATDSNELESEVKKSMVKRSSRLYLIIDHTKLNDIGLTQFASADEVDTIICDDGVDAESAQVITRAGIKLL